MLCTSVQLPQQPHTVHDGRLAQMRDSSSAWYCSCGCLLSHVQNGTLLGIPIVFDTNREDVAVGDKVGASQLLSLLPRDS